MIGKKIGGAFLLSGAAALTACGDKNSLLDSMTGIIKDSSHTCEIAADWFKTRVTGVVAWGATHSSKINFTTDSSSVSLISGAKVPYRLPNKLEGNSLSIYFITNQSLLDQWDKADIDKYIDFLKQNPNKTILLEWYADSRGDEGKNLSLSNSRAENIKSYILSRLPNAQIKIVAYWEAGKSKVEGILSHQEKLTLRVDRRVQISTDDMISRALSLSDADHYLLDASSSMKWEKWGSVKNFSYPKGARVSTFRKVDEKECFPSLETQKVYWHTPLYESLEEVIWKTSSWKSITVLTDWEDNNPASQKLEKIIKDAQSKWIKINTIWIWIRPHFADILHRIAKETGWKYYIN